MCLSRETEYSICYQSPQRDFITSSSTDSKSQKDTILCKWQGIFHLRLLMCKDIYLEGNTFIMANQRKGAFCKRKIYQEFLQDKWCDPGLCSWRWCVFEDNGSCLGILWLSSPCRHQAALTNGLQLAVEVVMKIVNHLTFIWHRVVPPGYLFSTVSFVDTALLLANDINRSMVSHLWAVANLSKSTWSGKLQIH